MSERTLEYSPVKKSAGFGRAAPVAIICTVLPIFGSVATAAFAVQIAGWLRAQGEIGIVYFTVGYILAGALMLATTYTSSALAGYTFGFTRGMLAILIGVTCGAMLAYVLARRLAEDRVRDTYGQHPKWDVVRRALVGESRAKAIWIVFLLRLSPVLPFGTTNVLLATSGVTPGCYLFGTVLGLLPRLGLVALAAASANSYEAAEQGDWRILAFGIAATITAIVIMVMLGKRALDRATREHRI